MPMSDQTINEKLNSGSTIETQTDPLKGKEAYQRYCLACHQADGMGIDKIHPPLNDPKWIANKDELIELVLKGNSGKIEVAGKTYNNIMPPHSHLTNKEIAEVLSYVRNSFGNNFGNISAEEVGTIRKKNNR